MPMNTVDAHTVLKQVDAWLSALDRRDTPALRRVRQQLSQRLATVRPSVVLAVADALVKRGGWEARLLAYESVAANRAAFAALDERRLVRWTKGLASWGTVDLFGCTLGGQGWRQGLVSDATVDAWSRSSDRWQRRLALACTVPLNSKARGGNGDASRTLRICQTLVDDRDDMVVKALSWSLRELSKRDPTAVRRFLARNQHRLAPRVRREVTSKLTTGRKAAPPRRQQRRQLLRARHETPTLPSPRGGGGLGRGERPCIPIPRSSEWNGPHCFRLGNRPCCSV